MRVLTLLDQGVRKVKKREKAFVESFRRPRCKCPPPPQNSQNASIDTAGPSSTQSQDNMPSYIDLGDCDQRCRHCGCLFWYRERFRGEAYARKAYNQMFAMMSLGAKIDDSVNKARGPYVFKVSGQIYHRIGSLCPDEDHESCFLQLYIYDTNNEVSNRMRHLGGNEGNLDPEIVDRLIRVLDEHNELVQLFRTARDECKDAHVPKSY
ncbi:hypothetical protein Tco_0775027 [Tanacetum coccineum]